MLWYLRALISIVTVTTAPFRWYADRRRMRNPSLTELQRPDPNGIPGQGASMNMKRGVGYCENTECEDYAKGVFLLNHGDRFRCPRCRQPGFVEMERGFHDGASDVFKEVRAEYNFCAVARAYREVAIVRDESIWGRSGVYTLQCPLIKTERRALKVAESLLATLSRYRGLWADGEIPRTTEVVLSFDDNLELFTAKLARVSKEWEASALAEKKVARENVRVGA